MFDRGLLLVLLVLLASCVPAASARHTDMPEPDRLSLYSLGALPAAELPQVIDSVTAPGSAAAPFAGGTDVTGRALDCLTAAVYYEARSESEDGQRAVAQVVLNRVRHPAFPRSVCDVVFQGRERRTGCQFSFTCDGSMHRGREPSAWARARGVAEAALSGYVFAPVGLATHFHTTAIHPWWASSMRRAITVGAHIFYRWPGQWGNPMAFRRPYEGGEGGIPAPTIAATISEARSVEIVAGVTIHRGGVGPAIADRSARTQFARDEGAHGVRIHRSSRAAPVSGASGETTAADAAHAVGEGDAALTR